MFISAVDRAWLGIRGNLYWILKSYPIVEHTAWPINNAVCGYLR